MSLPILQVLQVLSPLLQAVRAPSWQAASWTWTWIRTQQVVWRASMSRDVWPKLGCVKCVKPNTPTRLSLLFLTRAARSTDHPTVLASDWTPEPLWSNPNRSNLDPATPSCLDVKFELIVVGVIVVSHLVNGGDCSGRIRIGWCLVAFMSN